MSDPDELLNIEQAARFLNVSEASLRRWTNSGRLACLRVGRRRERRFRRADLLAFMEEQPAGGTALVRDHASDPAGETVIDGLLVAHGSHLCGVYRNDAGRVRLAAAFLADGFSHESVCYLVAPPAARRAIVAGLEKRRPSLRADIEAGRLVLSENAPTARAQRDYLETQFLRAIRAGARSLRLVGDMWGLGRSVSPRALMEFERSYEEQLARRFPVVALCMYDLRRFAGTAILDALKGHPDTFRYPSERLLA
jgi:excisionase family DNA binding protein